MPTLKKKNVILSSNLDTSELVSNKANKAWSDASTEEIRIAKILSLHITSKDKALQSAQLIKLVKNILTGNINELTGSKIDLSKTSTGNECIISSNLISQIALEIENRDADIKLSGSYFTPYLLAFDMVKISAEKWIKQNQSKEQEIIYNKISWYDPCIGGGVFPVAITDFLLSNGVPKKDIIKNVKGSDINPLFTEATRIRVALLLAQGNIKNFDVFYRNLEPNFSSENSLMSFSEAENIFSYNKQQYDIVIGNPPYVRSTYISIQLKKSLQDLYPSIWTGNTDLYMFFIAHGLNALKQNGVLCYISPASFQRTSSGSLLRSFIRKNASIEAIFDFDELKVFKGVSSHLSVYVLSKNNKRNKSQYFLFKELPPKNPLLSIRDKMKSVDLQNSDAWNFHTDDSSIILQISQNSIPLSKYVSGIYSGIKTGLKQAYELNQKHKEILDDEKSKPYILPLLKPKQIEKWSVNWDQTYQIIIPKGESINQESMAYKHLFKFKDALKKRTDLKDNREWYALRDCAYFNLFKKSKIVYRDISATPRFAMDTDGRLVVDGGFFIPHEDYFLLALLNSKVANYYFKNKCATIGSIGSRARLRFKKVYVSGFPIPKVINTNLREKITILSKEISLDPQNKSEEELDNLVFELYKLPEKLKLDIIK